MKMTFPKLDLFTIENDIDQNFKKSIEHISITESTSSTNDDAKSFLSKQSYPLSVHISDQQTGGKGRNGKKWISPKGRNIYISLGWKSPLLFSQLEGLSLAVGTVLANTLNQYTDNQIRIKWPNDILFKKRKMSGILIENLDLEGKVGVVIGIGINIHMTDKEGKEIDQSWISLDEATNKINNRNKIITDLLNGLFQLTERFPSKGFKHFKSSFEKLDLLKGKECKVISENDIKEVKALGVNDKGELLIKENKEYLALRYGEVSIREL